MPRPANGTGPSKEKGGYKSALARRQFTQQRVKYCRWSEHDKCLVCLNRIIEQTSPHGPSVKRTVRDQVIADDAQFAMAPV